MDELVEQVRKTGSIDGLITFAQKRDPCVSLFGKLKSTFQSGTPDRGHPQLWNVGVTVARNMPGMPADVLTSLTDANQIQHAQMDTLEPVGVTDQSMLHPDLKVNSSGRNFWHLLMCTGPALLRPCSVRP